MRGPPIVKAGRADHAKADFAADRLDAAHQVMRLFDLLHRHTVRNLCHPVRGQKARQEDIGIREIQLFLARVYQPRRNLKPPALLPVEQGGKDGGRVEVGKGHKVDGAIHPHQGYGIEITDDAVVFNGLIPFRGYVYHRASPA
jgi:hypothetical protein